MADYYSGTKTTIEKFLVAMKIGTDRISSITPDDFSETQTRIDDSLDDELSSVLYTPILKVQDKDSNSVYPGTIRTIALKRVAAELILTVFSDTEPNITQSAVEYKRQCDEEIARIQKREISIRGQIYKNYNKFIPPEIAPLTQPGTTLPQGG